MVLSNRHLAITWRNHQQQTPVEAKHHNEEMVCKLVAGKSGDPREIVCSYVPYLLHTKLLALFSQKSNKKVVCEL